jgi:hypothetical protein
MCLRLTKRARLRAALRSPRRCFKCFVKNWHRQIIVCLLLSQCCMPMILGLRFAFQHASSSNERRPVPHALLSQYSNYGDLDTLGAIGSCLRFRNMHLNSAHAVPHSQCGVVEDSSSNRTHKEQRPTEDNQIHSTGADIIFTKPTFPIELLLSAPCSTSTFSFWRHAFGKRLHSLSQRLPLRL